MLENFRYASEWEEFTSAVDKLSELLGNGQAHLLIGLKKDLDLELQNANEIQDSILEIIYDEVLYLMYHYLREGEFDEQELEEVFKDKKLSSKETQEYILMMKNKMEYICDVLINSEIEKSFKFKNNILLNKISSLDYNISNYELDNKIEVKHCILQIGVSRRLKKFDGNKMSEYVSGKNEEKLIEFVCNEEDIDYLIKKLEMLKKKIQK